MKRLLKFLAWLYPSEWRKRYRVEYEALLEQGTPRVRDALDVLLVGVKMQMTARSFVTIVLPCALAGALAAVAVSFSVPPRYSAQVVVTIMTTNQPASGRVDDLQRAFIDRDILASVIQDFKLYPSERSRVPPSDVINTMQRHIRFRAEPVTARINPAVYEPMLRIKPGKLDKLNFVVQFDYPDPHIAQQATADLLRRAFDANIRLVIQQAEVHRDSDAGLVLTVEHQPSLPENPDGLNRIQMGAIGLSGGLICGLIVAAVLRSRHAPTEFSGWLG